jgi:hypothetical protein
MVMESPISQSQIRRLAGWGDIGDSARMLLSSMLWDVVCSTELHNLYEYVDSKAVLERL